MDVITIYKLMKPHLDMLNPSEKAALSKLIISRKPEKITCTHRRKLSITKAKEKLKTFCRREMQREKVEHTSL